MVVSESVLRVVDNNHSRLINDLLIRQFLIDLRNENVLNDKDIYQLEATTPEKKQNNRFIKILVKKDDQAFYNFCHLLIQNQEDIIQNLGRDLLQQIGDESLLRGLPQMPESDYVAREKFNNTICNQLKRIDQCDGHILVHGKAGSGKTVAVYQAIRQLIIEEDCFYPNGCYWTKIGDIPPDKFFNKLRGLANDIGVEEVEKINSLELLKSNIETFLTTNEKLSTLFVFDDIWNEGYCEYLKFGKTIATSRFKHDSQDYIRIEAEEQFTEDEAMELIKKRRREDNQFILEGNELVQQVLKRCSYLPLAIAIIAGLNLNSQEDWQDVIEAIIEPNSSTTADKYLLNLSKIFELSAKRLSPEIANLFHLLGVFDAVKIPLESIASLWKIKKAKAKLILIVFNSKSLLTFKGGNSQFCLLHDLIIDYLRQPIDDRQSKEQYLITLNKTLIRGYCKRCYGKWSTYPHHDYYHYQYLIYHTIQAEDDDTIHIIMRDFRWMNVKLQSENTLYNLCEDIKMIINYLKSKEIENWNQYEELYKLLQPYKSTLQTEIVDLIQFLLTLDDKIVWIKECALELAKESDIEYWKIAMINYSNVDRTVKPLKSITLGENWDDQRIAVSNPCYENLRIIGTENNTEENSRIVIMDYKTSKNIYQITFPRSYIHKITISPDGHIVGFNLYANDDEWRYNKEELRRWHVCNVDNKKELYFTEDDIHKLQDQDFDELKFCPVLHNNDIILATLDKKQMEIWKIDGNKIRFINKKISIGYNIAAIDWVDNGSKILLWWKMYESVVFDKPQNRKNWINECQVQIWDLQSWHCLKSFSVPAYIIKRGNQYLPTINFDEGHRLDAVHYINSNDEYLVLNYSRLCGLLMLKNYDFESWYDKSALNSFHPFPLFLRNIKDVNISSNQQLISCLTDAEFVYVLKVINGRLQSFIKLEPSHDLHHSLFIPDNNRLLVYEESKSCCEYVGQGDSLRWRMLQNEGNDDDDYHQRRTPSISRLRNCSYAYINNNLVGIQLIDKGDTCLLKVLNFQQQSYPTQFDRRLDQKYDQCYIFDDLQSAFVIRTSRNKVLMNFLSQNEDVLQCKTYNILVDNLKAVIELRYRKADDTLIIVMEEKLKDLQYYLTIVTVNLSNGQKINYKDKDMYRFCQRIYMDELYLITYGQDLSQQKFVKCYQIGDDTNQSRNIATRKHCDEDKIACKIILPVNQSTHDLQFKSLLFDVGFEKEDWIERWGEKDGHLFDKTHQMGKYFSGYFMIEEGQDYIILNRFGEVLLKGNDNSFEVFKANISISNLDTLWHHKFWVGFNGQTQNIEMYEIATMKLYRILPFHYFHVNGFKWNREQSSLIAFDEDGQYCVFERV